MSGANAGRPTGAKPGRPLRQPREKRADRVAFRLTADELAQLEAEADRAGVSVSEYCRAAALRQRVKVRSSPDLSAALVALNRVGVNLNQLARMANRGQGVSHDLTEVLSEVRQAIERLAEAEE